MELVSGAYREICRYYENKELLKSLGIPYLVIIPLFDNYY